MYSFVIVNKICKCVFVRANMSERWLCAWAILRAVSEWPMAWPYTRTNTHTRTHTPTILASMQCVVVYIPRALLHWRRTKCAARHLDALAVSRDAAPDKNGVLAWASRQRDRLPAQIIRNYIDSSWCDRTIFVDDYVFVEHWRICDGQPAKRGWLVGSGRLATTSSNCVVNVATSHRASREQ